MDSKQSIEDFIFQLNDKLLLFDVLEIAKIIKGPIENKLIVCVDLIKKITDENEVIIIQDRGACVLPSRNLSTWFLDVIMHEDFPPKICLYLVSNFKPHYKVEEIFPQVISIQVDELERKDRSKLFFAYLSKIQLELNKEDADFFLEKFSGQPEQIIYTVDVINKESVILAKKHINEILEIGDRQVLVMLDYLKEFEGAMDLLVLVSKFDFISYDLIAKINPNRDQVEKLLEEFLAISAISNFGSNRQYFRLNSAIADYLKRSHIKVKDEFLKNMRKLFDEFSAKEGDVELKDISLFLFNVKEAIRRESKFSQKFFIPSFVLRSIVDIYYKSKYEDVIKLCDKVLYDSINYYEEIIREVRYWLCLSLCRIKNERFFKEVTYFRDIDEDFLKGFYWRISGQFDKAEFHYNKILSEKDIPKVKRELVTVLLGQRKYTDALELAKENYTNKKSNTYHIEAYFKCLVRKYRPNSEDRAMLRELIKGIEESYDSKKEVIKRTMEAEYEYFINHQTVHAINALNDIILTSFYNYYAIKSLIEIYEKQENFGAAHSLREKYREKLSESDESFDTY